MLKRICFLQVPIAGINSSLSLHYLHAWPLAQLNGSWVPTPSPYPLCLLSFSVPISLFISISPCIPLHPPPCIPSPGLLTAPKLSPDFLSNPRTPSPDPFHHSLSSPAPISWSHHPQMNHIFLKAKSFAFSAQPLFLWTWRKTQWSKMKTWLHYREPEEIQRQGKGHLLLCSPTRRGFFPCQPMETGLLLLPAGNNHRAFQMPGFLLSTFHVPISGISYTLSSSCVICLSPWLPWEPQRCPCCVQWLSWKVGTQLCGGADRGRALLSWGLLAGTVWCRAVAFTSLVHTGAPSIPDNRKRKNRFKVNDILGKPLF